MAEANLHPIPTRLNQLYQKIEMIVAAQQGAAAPLDGGGGGPHDPGMEQRVAKLEMDVGELKDILKRLEPTLTRIEAGIRSVEKDVSELKGRVAQMPTAWQLLIGIIGIMGATFGILKAVLPPH